MENFETIEVGDKMVEVVEKMERVPDLMIIPDSLYLNKVKYKNLTTFLYRTPRFASSDIYIYFKDCRVLYSFQD